MQRPAVAALLSALVFPGAGQLYLKRYRRAAAFLLPTLVCGGFVLQQSAQRANAILDRVGSGALALDADSLMAAVAAEPPAYPLLTTLAGWLLLACWLGSVVDAYRVARDQ